MTVDRTGKSESKQIPLLTTKLNMPLQHPDLVRRPRLDRPLEEGLRRKLTLVSAPAGFGKTTLLSGWFHQNETRLVWLSLDRGDNDPVRFLAHFITGLQKIDALIGKAALSELQSPQAPPVKVVMANLVNDINAVSEDIAFVLDDYHFISTPEVHDTVEFLLSHMPSIMHLFIATRSDPPIPVARLRCNNQLIELRASDLSFTTDEVDAFLNRMMALRLARSDVLLLGSRCEGWIAGLQLAALSIRGLNDVSGFIKAFAGDDRYIADYLMEEVLGRQPDAIQKFLLKTSILDRLSGSLCDSVTGGADGENVLDELYRANLFIVSLDSSRRWYRYHHLFAELLRQRLPRLEDCTVPDLHLKASEWFERNGLFNEAIDHALKAQDFDQVSQLVEQFAHTVLMKQGETSTILRWLEALPDDMIRRHPRLSLAYAWALFYAFKIDDLEPYLCDAEKALREKPDNDLLAEADAIRATVAVLRGSASRAIALFEQADDRLSGENLAMRGIVSMGLGYARMVSGDMAAAAGNLNEAIGMNEAVGNISIALKAAIFLAHVQFVQGRLKQAGETLKQALQLADRWDLLDAPVMCAAFGGLAELARERNDLPAAAQAASKAVEISRRSGDSLRLWHAYIVMSSVKSSQGNLKGAIDALQKAEDLIGSATSMPLAGTRTAACKIRALLAPYQIGDVDRREPEIMQWVRAFDLKDDWLERAGAIILPGQGNEYEHLTLAGGLIALGELDRASELVAGLREKSEKAGRLRSVIESCVLQAVALRLQDNTEQAVKILGTALLLAEPEGFIRIFTDAGPLVAEVLEAILAAGESDHSHMPAEFPRGYIKKLLLAFKAKAKTQLDEGLIEPLSGREVEVLHLLAARMSNLEIAEQLFISLNTVKTHIKNIISKLGVHGRDQAVARARELGLL
jgi:LuxR family maltose regulon positive regulatory protein